MTTNTTINTAANTSTNMEGEGQGNGVVFCSNALPRWFIIVAVVDVMPSQSSPVFQHVVKGNTGADCNQLLPAMSGEEG
jgi:hypothetical protein